MEPASWISLAAIFILTLVNGFFAAVETAVVSLRPSRIQELIQEGNRGARRVRGFLDNPHRFLATIQAAITFLAFFASAVGAVNLGPELAKVVPNRALAVALVTAASAFISVVGGEIVPKTLSLQHAERFALVLSGPLVLVERLFGPIVFVLEAASGALLRLLGVSRRILLPAVTGEEVRILIEEGEKRGTIEEDEVAMIHGVFTLADKPVRQVMTPRPDVIAVEAGTSADEALKVALEHGFSRLPVYQETLDTIVGIVPVREMAAALSKGSSTAALVEDLMLEPHYVPESRMIDDVLRDLQRLKLHMAIVVDEYGDVAGLATLEDIIEEIVGEIADESDIGEARIVALNADQALVDGSVSIADLNDEMGLSLDADGPDTVAGLVLVALGRVPVAGEQIEVGGATIAVENVENTRITLLKVTRPPQPAVGDMDPFDEG